VRTSYQPRKKAKTAFDINYNDSDEDENSLGVTDKPINQEIIDELDSLMP
jgi:hypothetical protein